MPNLGESIIEATVGKWFKQAGDTVAADEPLVELETDKVTVEVPAPASGVLGRDRGQGRRDRSRVGALLGAISEGERRPRPTQAKPEAATQPRRGEASAIAEALRRAAPPPAPKTLEREPQRREEVSAEEMPPSPAARKLIAEAGLARTT